MRGTRRIILCWTIACLAMCEIFSSSVYIVKADNITDTYDINNFLQQEETVDYDGDSNYESSSSYENESTYDITTEKEQTTSQCENESTTKQELTSESITTEFTTEVSTTKKEIETSTTEIIVTTHPAWSKVNGKFYNDKNEVISGAIKKGIDVSHHQGNIDWEKVSNSDVDFVIIRCGYGDDYKSQDDKYFKQNIEMCKKYKIPYGIYLYSYAMNMKQVKSEVKHTLRLLKEVDAKPTYPVFYDMEEKSQYYLGKDILYSFAEYYCNEIIKAGYKSGVYSSYYWWTTNLSDSRFNQWYRWVARYNSFCGYQGDYIMWQSTSSGSVSGILGRVDINFQMSNACDKAGHKNKWITTKNATALSSGRKKCVCKKCGKILKFVTVKKLKATGRLNKNRITLKYKAKYKKLKVLNLAKGDYIKRFSSSNKKIATVNKKGIITAKKKKGNCIIKVWLASGKRLSLKVIVRKNKK